MLVAHSLVLHNMIKNNVFLSDLIPNKHNLEIVTILIMDVEYTMIHGYYDRGKLSSIKLANMKPMYWSVCSSRKRGGYKCGRGRNVNLALLENMKIQIIINPLLVVKLLYNSNVRLSFLYFLKLVYFSNVYRIHVYINKGKFVANLAS